jgi:hypothetical protein
MPELMQPQWQQVWLDGNHGSIFSTGRPRQLALQAVNLDIPAAATLSAKFGLRIMPLTFSVANLMTPALAVSR